MPSFWIRRTGFLVIALPLTIVFVHSMVRPKPGPSALTLATMLGVEGAILALATFAFVSVAAYKEIKEPSFGPRIGFEPRMRVWGFLALGFYFLSWLGIVAWLIT